MFPFNNITFLNKVFLDTCVFKVGRYLTREIAENNSCFLFCIELCIRVLQSVLFIFQ